MTFQPEGGPFAIAGAIGTSNHDGVTLPVITQIPTGINVKTVVRTPATVLNRSQHLAMDPSGGVE